MGPILNAPVEPVSRPEEAVRRADIVLTATNSSVPVFDGDWLEPGVHVTTIVGSNVGLVQGGFITTKRREIDDTTLTRSSVLALASIQQAIQDEQGDIFDPVQKGIIRWEQLIEIGAILAGKKDGRVRPEQITLFKNNAGQGVADVALGALILRKVIERGGGQRLSV
jgi:alanine dehydrogenase